MKHDSIQGEVRVGIWPWVVGAVVASAAPGAPLEASPAPEPPSELVEGVAWSPSPVAWPGARVPDAASAELSGGWAGGMVGRAAVAVPVGPVVVDVWGWSLVEVGFGSAFVGGHAGVRWPLPAGPKGRFRAAPFLAAGPGWVTTPPCAGYFCAFGEDGVRAVVLAGVPMRWSYQKLVLDLVAVLPGLELGHLAFLTVPVGGGVGVAFLPPLLSEFRAVVPLGGRAWTGAGLAVSGLFGELGFRRGNVAFGGRAGVGGGGFLGQVTVSWEGGPHGVNARDAASAPLGP